jgi:DNA polymerase I-like protein with 3'-5' exonuclease and polymerase domains
MWCAPTELPDLRRVGIVAFDLETKDDRLRADMGSGWPFAAGHICGVSIAYRAGGEIRAHYFPLRHPDSVNFDPAPVYQWLRDLIASRVRIVTQNGGYDFGWLRTEAGIKMPPGTQLEEIGALATLVDENRFSYKLDALCAWRGIPGKDDTLLKEGAAFFNLPKRAKLAQHIWQMPARFVGPYAEQDAISTLLLFESLDPVLDQEGTREAYRLECDLLPMVLEMRRRGIRVDVDAAVRARDNLLQKRDAVFAELSEKLGVNVGMAEIGRTKWLAETFDRLNIKYPRTAKGNPSFTAGNTGWMPRHEHEVPRLIVRADKLNNAGEHFLRGYILDHVVNGRVHAEIHPHRSDEGGTRSLRFSYSKPPLQLMTAHDEELTPLIRGCFLPEKGEVWARPDISQQEFRFIVHYAAELQLPRAQEAVARYCDDPNTDFHALVSEWTGIPRQSAKNVNFAKAFGAGVRKFAVMIGKPENEAQGLYARYDRELPFVSALARHCEKQANRFGYLELYDGARRHWNSWVAWADWTKGAGPCSLEEANRRITDSAHPWYQRGPLRRADCHKALNGLIQGSAARHTKLWMRAVWREGITPLLQMHDSLDCSVSSPEQAELVARLAQEVVSLAVPIRVDLAYGRNWADARHSWAELHGQAPNIPDVEPVLTEVSNPVPESVVLVDSAPDPAPPESNGNGCNRNYSRDLCRALSFLVFPDKAMTPAEAAISLAVQGIFSFPAPPNAKKSYKSEKFSGAKWGMTRDPREVERNFKRWPNANVGIPTGPINGFFVVETDIKNGVDGASNLQELIRQYGGEWPKTRMAMSPSGSTHYYFRNLHDDVEIRNSQSVLADGIDVRGSGGMVIAPPSQRNGGQYRWLNGLDIAPAPPWLLDLIHASQSEHDHEFADNGSDPDAAEPVEKIKMALVVLKPKELGHDGILKVGCALFRELGDAVGFNLLTDWLEHFAEYFDAKLAREQWRSIVAKDGYGYRIGSLYFLADEADPEWRARWFDDAFAGDSAPEEETASENSAGNGAAAAENSKSSGNGAGTSGNAAASSEIIEPVDLWGRFDPPLLPSGFLPEVLERFAFEEADLTGADPSGIAVAALTVCAAALPDCIQVQVKKHDPNWMESARLWVGLIGLPSTKKTPIIQRAAKPLKRIDAELWRAYVAACECYEGLSKEERKQVERPRQRRLRIEDTTIEAAQEVLKDSPDGVLAIQDELAGWFGAMDKYSGRGAAKDRGFWLQSFHGGPYALNRIARGAAMIENLSVSLLGGIQPEPIRKIAEDTVDDGLLQRLIPIVLRHANAGKDLPTGQAAERYDHLIEHLHRRGHPGAPLRFGNTALAIREELEHRHLALMACEVINRKLAAHIGKYDGLFARLCLLWHCIEDSKELEITEHTARRVADFMHRFLLPHATAFYADMLELSDDHDRLTKVAGYILAKNLSRVTNRDVQRGSRAMRGLERLEIESIFEQLEALGWLTRTPSPYRSTPLHWQVNPEVHRRFAERAVRETAERAKEHEILQEMFKGGSV